MQSAANLQSFETFQIKNEIITIEEDEIQAIKKEEFKEDEQFKIQDSLQDGTTLNYYFEPQEKSNFAISLEDKTDNDKEKNSIKILCSNCPPSPNNVFEERSTFELHYKRFHKEQPIVFACVICKYNAKKFILFRNHFKRHLVGRYQCSECTNSYSLKNDLNHHKSSVHGRKRCRKCNMEFESLQSFAEHKKCNHTLTSASKSKLAEKECPDCGKMLQTTGGLFTHRKMHLEKPKFRCLICQKQFFQKVNLLNHEKTHNIQNRSYSCSQCEKSFFEKSHLVRHQNFHSESRDYQCNQCLKFYKTERCLKVHKQVHSDPSSRPFKCGVCQKGFLSSSKLKQHANIHTNSRPYLCKHCPRDFTNYPNLLKHTIRRHKVDHRTGKPLDKIPDYVTNKKKKKIIEETKKDSDDSLPAPVQPQEDLGSDINVIQIPDDGLELPSTSGLVRGFQFNDDTNYDIFMDIDEFSDFQLLSPDKDYDVQDDINEQEQFSIIDATDLQFFSEHPNIIQLVSSGQIHQIVHIVHSRIVDTVKNCTIMRSSNILILLLSVIGLTEAQDNVVYGNVDGKRVKCLTCRATVDEIRIAQSKVDPKKKAEVKSGRFQVDGTTSGQLIEYRKSEQYLTELFEGDEGICKVLDDYAKAKYKTDGRLTVLKMFDDFGMNPLTSQVDFVQDQDLNKSLKHYCLEILDEFDELFLEYFMADSLPDNLVDAICVERSKLCKEDDEQEEEDEAESDSEQENIPEKEL
ncbi:CLUMA_CG002494, isoform A [Clunio marinus]|uniref:CLUMA_CG002494, isoform A n=1 Tax=Clunio marinus TaxID=568069 RepID=A0A1J1HM03_9DIPT|nr:CLUMA_CG002494, isoform A [Clunio marinus]